MDASPEDAEGRCPDCGGDVRATAAGEGVCDGCGATLVAKDSAPPEEAAPRSAIAERLSQLIKSKVKAGANLDYAVDSSCAELLSDDPPAPEEESPSDCLVCGTQNPPSAVKCGGCGVYFGAPDEDALCPRCGEPCSKDKCSCGAILTLSKVLEYVDPSVLYVCPGCRQVYSAVTLKCPDCGAKVLPADRLKRYAAGL